jgi:hypothetical protein
MKSFVILLLVSLLFPMRDTAYIKFTRIDKNGISIHFDDSTSLKCPITKEKSKRWFCLKEKSKIYLDVDNEAKWKVNIDSLLKANTIRPKLHIGEMLPIMYLVFIVDENGKIFLSGLDREIPQDDYQKEFFRLVKLINADFEPATLGGKKVASVFKYNVNYYTLFDK